MLFSLKEGLPPVSRGEGFNPRIYILSYFQEVRS
jgi:hypothetical protein